MLSKITLRIVRANFTLQRDVIMDSSNSNVDYSISDLLTRYKITKPALYTRFKGLRISTFKVGRKAYVTSEDVELLDKLDQHIYDNGTIADFVHDNEAATELSKRSSKELKENPEAIPVNQSNGWLNSLPLLVNSLADAIAQKITPPANPLAELEALEKAYEKKWILSTSQLGSILKLNSKTLARQKSFERHGFTFTRCGQVGAEIGWRIGLR